MRYVFLLNQFPEHERKPRLPEENCAWGAAALLCAVFLQLLRQSRVCPPFGFQHHRIRQKFE